MHLPVLPLLAGAVGRLGSLECQGMDGLQGKVPEHILDLAGLDIFLVDLRESLADVAAAEGTLVIGVLDERHLRVLVPPERGTVHIDHQVRGRAGRGRLPSLPELHDLVANLGEDLLDGVLARLQGFHLLGQVTRRLC